MSGKKILLDTNIVLYILGGKINFDNIPEGIYLISVITEIELLSYPSLNEDERKKINKFLSKIDIVELNNKIKNKTIEYRKKLNLKIPDAIICATAFIEKAILITNDKKICNPKNKLNITIISV
jgi:hypothetical protein